MINSLKKFYLGLNLIEKILFILLSLFPITFILGNFLINLFFLLISVIFIISSFKDKDHLFLKDPILWIFFIFFTSLVINLFFSIDSYHSMNRVLKIILIILYTLQIKKFIHKYQIEFEKIILGFWSFIFFFVLLDTVFEIFFGHNTLGFSTPLEGRVASFFGDELVVGAFFNSFCLIFISYIFAISKKSEKFCLLTILILIIISFFIGERSNFIKVFLCLTFFSIFIIRLKLKHFISFFFLIFTILILFISFNDSAKNRYFHQVEKIFTKNGIDNYLISSPYGAHYNAAHKIFKEYPIFGVGIKNYRIESGKEKYKNDKYEWTHFRSTTHPHQIHLELLAETGIFGYFFFLIFILSSLYLSVRNYLKYKNVFQFSSMLYVVFYLTPILPSGSFFSTFSSGLFWINYAVMVSYIKNN
jgi:O-antigen ligase